MRSLDAMLYGFAILGIRSTDSMTRGEMSENEFMVYVGHSFLSKPGKGNCGLLFLLCIRILGRLASQLFGCSFVMFRLKIICMRLADEFGLNCETVSTDSPSSRESSI